MFSKLDDFLWKHEKKIKIITLLLALVAGFFAISSWKNSLIGASVALYLLYAILFFPIFSRVFGIKIFGTLLKFREELGILIGVLSLAHLYQMLPYIEIFAKSKPILVIFGILPQIIILILTLTSNEFSRKKLGKNWKKLHRLAYIVPILIMIQQLATQMVELRLEPNFLIFLTIGDVPSVALPKRILCHMKNDSKMLDILLKLLIKNTLIRQQLSLLLKNLKI